MYASHGPISESSNLQGQWKNNDITEEKSVLRIRDKRVCNDYLMALVFNELDITILWIISMMPHMNCQKDQFPF